MNEDQATILLDFIDGNWTNFESLCSEKEEDPEEVRKALEKIALGN